MIHCTKRFKTWWRHQMETFSALLAICAGNSPVTGEFLAQRPVTQKLWCFFDLRLNKRLSKQSRGWWFETPSCPLWRHRNERRHILKSTQNIFVPLRYCLPNTVWRIAMFWIHIIFIHYVRCWFSFESQFRAAILGVQSCTSEYDVIFVYCGSILWFVLLIQTLLAYLCINIK